MIETALLLATLNKTVIDYFTEPLKKAFPGLDMWWLTYVALVTGFILSWVVDLQIFGALGYITDPVTNKILSGILVGGGSSLIHQIFDKVVKK